MDVKNYGLLDAKVQHFTGPVSDSDYGFRTVPSVLRAVADWMDKNDVQDPEFDNLKIGLTFPEDAANDFYQHATLYYRLETDRK